MSFFVGLDTKVYFGLKSDIFNGDKLRSDWLDKMIGVRDVDAFIRSEKKPAL